MDQPRGAAQVRDAAIGGGISATGRAVTAASCSRAAGATGFGDDRTWNYAPSVIASGCHESVVIIVHHVAMPTTAQEPVDVLHQHRRGAVSTTEEKGHLPSLQPATDLGDTHVRGGGSVGRAGHPGFERVARRAHAFRFYSHFVATTTTTTAATATPAARRRGAECTRDAAATAAATGADGGNATHTGLRARAGAQLADQSATPAGTNAAAAAVAGNRGGHRRKLQRRQGQVSLTLRQFRFLPSPPSVSPSSRTMVIRNCEILNVFPVIFLR